MRIPEVQLNFFLWFKMVKIDKNKYIFFILNSPIGINIAFSSNSTEIRFKKVREPLAPSFRNQIIKTNRDFPPTFKKFFNSTNGIKK